MRERIGIIADDFTGANDTGVQLAKKGFLTSVMVNIDKMEIKHENDVSIIDTNSRSFTNKDAYEAVHHAASFYLENQVDCVYKKVDSTLRGNIGSEISAVDHVLKPDLVVIAPAYPQMGRITKDGKHYVDGELVSDTEFGKDPKTPVTQSDIQELIQPYCNAEISKVTQTQLNDDEFATYIQNEVARNIRWFVCDAESEEDLKKISSKFGDLPLNVLWVGSAGLIEHLPEGLSLNSNNESNNLKDWTSNQVLTVSGSLSERTKQQLLELDEIDDIQMIEIDPLMILEETFDPNSLLDRKEEKKDLVIYVDNNEFNRKAALEYAERNALSKEEIGSKISKGLGQIAKHILRFTSIDGLILTGGDTAKDVCSAMNVMEMELLDEIEAGVPLGRINFNDQKLWTVTKAGGFGNKDTLKNALYYMKGMKHTYDSK
ncbi:four-carbon acid sugar kinase family protein [Bacillus sp. Marseille-Q3570]|uniref:four-carbon acid sugar kinase family protein n=1 Tax=Bacillus sp. Marseille-Q3570 TaxID=2963522 RepID=UPI0021B7A9E0|nr:four-carbon acid sugar kinase family protein [Bacillus sp. Marseille-Q3570]